MPSLSSQTTFSLIVGAILFVSGLLLGLRRSSPLPPPQQAAPVAPRRSGAGFWVALILAIIVGVIVFRMGLVHLPDLSSFLSEQSGSAPSTHQVQRINQLDAAQYASEQQYHQWSGSTCSTAAMTELMNAYRNSQHPLRISDVLTVEETQHAISPDLGLLSEDDIARTVAPFGFQTQSGHTNTLDQVIARANQGTPGIVSFPPQPRYPTGHLLVVTGGYQQTVDTVDSSRDNRTSFARSDFASMWGGFAAIVTPKKGTPV